VLTKPRQSKGATRFGKGTTYTREEISAKLGGGTQDCISHVRNRVVAICLTRDMNPQAPAIMLVGTGRDKIRYSEIYVTNKRTRQFLFS